MQANKTEPQHKNEPAARLPHTLIMEDCKSLSAAGIMKIISYEEAGVVLETAQGILTVAGSALQVSELSIESGKLEIQGKITSIQYAKPALNAGGFWHRLNR